MAILIYMLSIIIIIKNKNKNMNIIKSDIHSSLYLQSNIFNMLA